MVGWIGTTGPDSYTSYGLDAFGLQGDDTLRSAQGYTVGLVGGTGNDTYIHSRGSVTTVIEAGNSPNDWFIENNIVRSYGLIAILDGRHLVIATTDSSEGYFIVDWERPENRIEFWQLTYGQVLSFSQFQSLVYGAPGLVWGTIEMVYGPEVAQLFNAVIDYGYSESARLESLAGNPPIPPPSPHQNIEGSVGGDVLDGDWGNDTIHGYSGADTIRGLDGNDAVYGDDGNDDVNGNRGNDRVHGGPGQDFVRGGQGDDAVYGQDDDDWHVNGNIGNDSVYGGTGNDQVFGGPGQDTLYGETGNDVLSGDLGNDRLFGGPGSDHYVFHSGAGWDLIQDFKRAEGDKILVEGNINGTGITTAQQLVDRTVSDGGGGWIVDIGNGDKIGILNAARPIADDFWIV